ncbi:hypothetical protein ACQPXB_10940 [Amycolatopsis sp. CA-161197]|uniref:hypothetical protein n=1 Tax=Amycolatopsis sp. CA-161197 TaxID=3239922 RepID=UPI003D92DC5E
MPIATAHHLPPMPHPHLSHPAGPHDSRQAGALGKQPSVALARNHHIAPARASVPQFSAFGGILSIAKPNRRALVPSFGFELSRAARVVVAGHGSTTTKTACGYASRWSRHAEPASETCVITANDGVPLTCVDSGRGVVPIEGTHGRAPLDLRRHHTGRVTAASDGVPREDIYRFVQPVNCHAEPDPVTCASSTHAVVLIEGTHGRAPLDLRRHHRDFSEATQSTVAEVA